MGRNALHTPEQVFKVADDLAAQGKEVTPNVLHGALGGGSMTTIYKHLAAWKEQRKQLAAPVPVAMPESVLASFNQAWQVAAQEAAKEVAAIREAAETSVKESDRNLADAILTITRLEGKADEESTKLDLLMGELSNTKRAANATATEAAKREAALAATVGQMQKQLEEQQTALQRGHEEHQTFRQDKAEEVTRLTADFMARLAEQAEALRIAKSEADSLRSKLDDSDSQLAVAREEQGKARADVAQYKAAAQQAEKGLADTRRLLDEANARALDLTSQLGNSTGQCDALRAQVQSQEDLIKSITAKDTSENSSSTKTRDKPAATDPGKVKP
jgi:chromosome segregation ATPase